MRLDKGQIEVVDDVMAEVFQKKHQLDLTRRRYVIPKSELDKAVEIARRYGVGELYLIGSALYKEPEEANDYDFAVRDVPAGNFFKFYGKLFRALSKNADLIDLSGKMTKFKDIILREGRLVYDKTSN